MFSFLYITIFNNINTAFKHVYTSYFLYIYIYIYICTTRIYIYPFYTPLYPYIKVNSLYKPTVP